MTGETNLQQLLKTMQPKHVLGEYVFCTVAELSTIPAADLVLMFREEEGYTVIVTKHVADNHQLKYSFIAAWITLTAHSSLQAVGLTAAFSKALADNGISCNVVAAYYHDHIFVTSADADKAMQVLQELSRL